MRIVVCIKQIAHTYARTGTNVDQHFLAEQDQIFRINPYDEVAMEAAYRLKKEINDATITAITIGPVFAEKELQRCLALGADNILHIDADANMEPWPKSALLARTIKSEAPADLVLCGKESLDSQSGLVGAFLARHLEMGFVSAITKLEVNQDRSLGIVQRSAGRGVKEVVECRMPAVFSVDSGGEIDPHVPTWEDKKNAKTMEFKTISAGDDLPVSKVVQEEVYPPRPRPKAAASIETGAESYDRVMQLLTGSRVQKQGTLEKGDPEFLADKLVSFLQENDFLMQDKDDKES